MGQAIVIRDQKDPRQLGDTWYLNGAFIKINDVLYRLWRTVDKDGHEIDILVQNVKINGLLCISLSDY